MGWPCLLWRLKRLQDLVVCLSFSAPLPLPSPAQAACNKPHQLFTHFITQIHAKESTVDHWTTKDHSADLPQTGMGMRRHEGLPGRSFSRLHDHMTAPSPGMPQQKSQMTRISRTLLQMLCREQLSLSSSSLLPRDWSMGLAVKCSCCFTGIELAVLHHLDLPVLAGKHAHTLLWIRLAQHSRACTAPSTDLRWLTGRAPQ